MKTLKKSDGIVKYTIKLTENELQAIDYAVGLLASNGKVQDLFIQEYGVTVFERELEQWEKIIKTLNY